MEELFYSLVVSLLTPARGDADFAMAFAILLIALTAAAVITMAVCLPRGIIKVVDYYLDEKHRREMKKKSVARLRQLKEQFEREDKNSEDNTIA